MKGLRDGPHNRERAAARKPSAPAESFVRFPQALPKILAPTFRQRWRIRGTAEGRLVVGITRVECSDVSYRQSTIVMKGELDAVAGPDLTLAKHGKIEARATASQKSLDHVLPAESDS